MRRHSRRAIIRVTATAASFLLGRFPLFAQTQTEYSSRAIRLVEETTVVDLLNQFRFANNAEKPPKADLWFSKPGTFLPEDVAEYERSGIRVFAVGRGAADYQAGIRLFGRLNSFLAEYSDVLLRIDDIKDFERVRKERKIGVMLTTQDCAHFRTPADVDEFFYLGQRIAQLTYNFNNRIGSGFLEHRDGGLSVFGRSIMERMEKVGMAVDVSHCGDQTTLDALEVAKKPVLFTHATCRGVIAGHLRAKSDEAIRKMAKTGGLMGIAFIRFLVRSDEPVGVENVLDHFDHVRKLVGVEHLAIGSDLDLMGFGQPMGFTDRGVPSQQPNFDRYGFHVARPEHVGVDGLDHPKRIFDLTEGLIRRGYSDNDIRLILGGNASRVLAKIWGG